MESYTITQADVEFHSQIMYEHCIFLHLGMEVEPYKDQAYELCQEWKAFITAHHPEERLLPLLRGLRRFKTEILAQLLEGVWLGWLSASFVRHLLEELEIFRTLLAGQKLPPALQALQTYRLLLDHVEEAESRTDNLETEMKVRERGLVTEAPAALQELAHREFDPVQLTQDYQQALEKLAVAQSQPTTEAEWMIGLTLRASEQMDVLWGELRDAKVKTIIHPLLLSHWERESKYYTQELRILLSQLKISSAATPLPTNEHQPDRSV